MQVYISYFYNIRFFPRTMIPVSTAVFDPKWYHNFKGNNYIFKDKNGVYNGVRLSELSPEKVNNHTCSKDCKFNPENCLFISSYKDYIYSLDFKKVYNFLTELSEKLRKQEQFNIQPDVCLMVHEKPDNPCSERKTLVQWFADNGITVKEFVQERKF